MSIEGVSGFREEFSRFQGELEGFATLARKMPMEMTPETAAGIEEDKITEVRNEAARIRESWDRISQNFLTAPAEVRFVLCSEMESAGKSAARVFSYTEQLYHDFYFMRSISALESSLSSIEKSTIPKELVPFVLRELELLSQLPKGETALTSSQKETLSSLKTRANALLPKD